MERTRPGPGPEDFYTTPTAGADLIESIERILGPKNSADTFLTLITVYRMMGSPRSWQLAGLDELEKLGAECKRKLRRATLETLSTIKDEEKYVYVWEPLPCVPEELEAMALMDFKNEEVIEKLYWLWTMPRAFLDGLIGVLDRK